MKKDDRLILYRRIEELIFYSKNLLIKFPKSERFTLSTDIMNSCYTMLRLTLYAVKTNYNIKRIEFLEECDIEKDYLKVLMVCWRIY